MPALYDVTSHALLSGGAKYLTPTELELNSMLAESLLGFANLPAFTGVALDKAKMAVALQVSFQVERGIDGAVVQSKTEGVRSMTYRADIVHPMALKVAQSIIGTSDAESGYEIVRSKRGVGQAPYMEYPSYTSTGLDPDQHLR